MENRSLLGLVGSAVDVAACPETGLCTILLSLLPSQAVLCVIKSCANTAVLKELTEEAYKRAAVIFLLALPYGTVITVVLCLAGISGGHRWPSSTACCCCLLLSAAWLRQC